VNSAASAPSETESYNLQVWKFIGYLVLLGSIAVGAAWYSVRAGIVPASVTPNRHAVAEDTSWLADLYSQNPRDTEKGTAKVERLGARALPQIQATLRNPGSERNHRRAALRACAILGVAADPAIPEVAATLPERDLAADAAVALSFMGPRALPPLQEALSNGDPTVRREALRSIGKLRFRAPLQTSDVLPIVLDAMTDPDTSVRAVAATYLGIMHEDPTGSVPLLAQGLEDPDPAVRRASATALGSFGSEGPAALPALKKAAADQDTDLAREAGRAIVAITGK
jgi:HEAT repeat protein